MTVSTPSMLFPNNHDNTEGGEGGEVFTLATHARQDLTESNWEPIRRRGKTRKAKRSNVQANLRQAHIGGDR